MTPFFNALAAPFKPSEIEWRLAESGKRHDGSVWAKCFAYVTNRAIQQRLDDVAGPPNWKPEFVAAPNAPPGTGAMCILYLRIDSGEWVGKPDGAPNTEYESLKGGLSDSMKRAAVQWGIGRYLYDLPEGFAETSLERQKDWHYAKTKDGTAFYWLPPRLPDWALPSGTQQPEARQPAQSHQPDTAASSGPPAASGKPPCPNCGKSEWVLEDKEQKGHYFCWKNAAKKKLGCGHKWADVQALASELGLKPASEITSAFEIAKAEIAKAVKTKDLMHLTRVKDRVVERTVEGVITTDGAAELDGLIATARKQIKSGKELDSWTSEKQAEALSRDPLGAEMQEMRDCF